jgi:hypothetical protein
VEQDLVCLLFEKFPEEVKIVRGAESVGGKFFKEKCVAIHYLKSK